MPIASSNSVIHVERSFLNPDFQGHQVGTVRVSSIMHVWSQKSITCNFHALFRETRTSGSL